MAPPVTPVSSDKRLPERAEVVIVGGGIIGCAILLELAERGIPALLCEKGRIGAEQSSRNWGWCRQMGRDAREIPLARESLALWRRMNERVGAETGFRQCGIVYIAADGETLARRVAWIGQAQHHQIDTRYLSYRELRKLLPGIDGKWAGGVYTPGDGRAEPALAAPAMVEAARRKGAAILTGCAVRGVETSAGRISAVVTEKGRVQCSSVVVAGGAWSRLFLQRLNVTLPQLQVISSALRTTAQYDCPPTAVGGPGFAFRRRADGGYTVAHGGVSIHHIVRDSVRFFGQFQPALSMEWKRLRLRLDRDFLADWKMPRHWRLDAVSPFERMRVLDPEPALDVLDEAMNNLRRAFPPFASVRVVERWAGAIDVTPDAIPVISAVDRRPGLFVATGFSGHGFGIAPGAGRLAADLITGDAPVVNPAPFRFSRFIERPLPQPVAGF